MKNKKLFAILTLVCFMFTLMPVAAFAADPANSNSVAFTEDDAVDVSYKYEGAYVENSATFGLRVLDVYGDNVTTKLYVWVTKDGSKAPVNTVTVNAEEDTIGTEVFELENVTTAEEAFTVEFYSTGKYAVHVSATEPTIANGVITNAQEFNYAGNVVEVSSNPVDVKNYGAKVTLPANYTLVAENGGKTPGVNGVTVADGEVVSALAVKANNVAEEKVKIELINKLTNKPLGYKTLTITPVGAIEVDAESVTTNALGMAEFKVSGHTEGTYKVYVTCGQFEFTVEVVVGATSANEIKCVDEPTNPIDILNEQGALKAIDFEMYDVNGNVIDPAKVNAGWECAAKVTPGEQYAGYVAVVEQPAASKLTNKDLYFDGVNVVTKKPITAEGTYTFKVVLDNGNFATGSMEVKAFTTPVELVVEYPATVELGASVEMGDLYWLDANKVQKDAKGISLAATGYAIANFDSVNGELNVKSDEKYVGSEITITAVDERYNLVDTVVVKVADEAAGLAFATKTAEVDVNNKIVVSVVDQQGSVVTLGTKNKNQQNANFSISYVILDKPEGARVFASTVAGSEKLDSDGTFKMNLTSNKVGNVAVQAVVKYSYLDAATNANVVKYYTGTQIFAVGNGQVGDVVVMSIGSNEIIINDAKAVIDAAPIVENNRTFVPFRALAEAFGATVAYDEATQAVTAELNGVTVVMTIGSAEYTVNGVAKTADVAPFINGSRTMVPVRFAAEAFGIKVIPTYDENGATADILFNL